MDGHCAFLLIDIHCLGDRLLLLVVYKPDNLYDFDTLRGWNLEKGHGDDVEMVNLFRRGHKLLGTHLLGLIRKQSEGVPSDLLFTSAFEFV